DHHVEGLTEQNQRPALMAHGAALGTAIGRRRVVIDIRKRQIPAESRGTDAPAAEDQGNRHRYGRIDLREVERHRSVVTAARAAAAGETRIRSARRVVRSGNRRELRRGRLGAYGRKSCRYRDASPDNGAKMTHGSFST